MGWPKGKKRGPQTPAHTANAVAARAKAVEGRVWVSRNDANMLEVLRAHLAKMSSPWNRLEDEQRLTTDRYVRGSVLWDGTPTLPLHNEVDDRRYAFETLSYAWLNGEDVLIAKLSQE